MYYSVTRPKNIQKHYRLDIGHLLNMKLHDTADEKPFFFREAPWNFLLNNEFAYLLKHFNKTKCSKTLRIRVTKKMKNEYDNNKLKIHNLKNTSNKQNLLGHKRNMSRANLLHLFYFFEYDPYELYYLIYMPCATRKTTLLEIFH